MYIQLDLWRRIFRFAVLGLTIFYFLDRALAETWGLDSFGWQFRYLTNWALTLSMVAAAMMLTRRFGGRDDRGAVFVSLVAVVNMLVVFSYWRLYFIDPALVNGGESIVAYREYYLHLAGPVLQLIDVLWIKRAFRFVGRTVAWLAVAIVVYVTWAEAVVGPLNAEPVGDVTSGLPYPFLNDMTWTERGMFYLSIFVTGIVLAIVLRGCQSLVFRLNREGRSV